MTNSESISRLDELNAELEEHDLSLTPEHLLDMQRKRLRNEIVGISATLLPMQSDGRSPNMGDFHCHVQRTAGAGLIPAVNMDTGYRNLLDDETSIKVLDQTRSAMSGITSFAIDNASFVAGAFVGDNPGDEFNLDEYARQVEAIKNRDGMPVIFQSYGLTGPGDVVERYRRIAEKCGKFIGFELGQMFAPFGSIYDLPTYRGLMGIQECIAAKHSSLDRGKEWQRLVMRDVFRPEFMVLTGNDWGIDMVRYGSDYLLGLSTFEPEVFAKRDKAWELGDVAGFDRMNDPLQDLGNYAFRDPTAAYKHDAALYLHHHRGLNATDKTHADAPERSAREEIPVLRTIGDRIIASGY
jgi:hypothetical protein